MTKIRHKLGKNYFAIEAKGHAGVTEQGEDVCCAVSTLMQTALQVLLDMQYHEELETLHYHIESGDMYLFANGKGWNSRKLKHCAEQLLTGLRLIEKKYPEHVQFVGVT